MSSRDDIADTHNAPHAMAFTVTFGAGKVVSNKFLKRHVRNLSLPVSKVYDNNCNSEVEINGKCSKNIGNHSEGYFSSDPEEDLAHAKVEPDRTTNINGAEWSGECEEEEEDEDGNRSDVASETGTYTIEKDSVDVINARISLEERISLDESLSQNPPMSTSRDSPHWIKEWANQVSCHNQQTSVPKSAPISRPSSSPRPQSASKIPSPMVTRARLGNRTAMNKQPSNESTIQKQEERDDAERHLKTTERVMEALAARLSLDSESEPEPQAVKSTDSSASDSGVSRPPPSQLPHHASSLHTRSFSMRRGRVEDSSFKKNSEGKQKRQEEVFKTPLPAKNKTPTTPVLSRVSAGRIGIPSSPSTNHSIKSAQPAGAKPAATGVKKKAVGGGRSNSTLSSKEVEFQNWKRRKSYDPMKAAAEGKMKEAKRTVNPQPASSQPPNSGVGGAGGGVSVLRSASFHGTRQLGATLIVPSSSEDDEDQRKDWPLLTAPRTSRETTPLGSRVSLCSNNSSPRVARHRLEGVDNLVVSAVTNLSGKLKLGASTLLRKLRCLYDEESDKSRQLTLEIDQLESVSDPSSPHMSPSKELACTLRNLKRLDSMFKVLDEVLFENTEYE